jgi:hypothetical protein
LEKKQKKNGKNKEKTCGEWEKIKKKHVRKATVLSPRVLEY